MINILASNKIILGLLHKKWSLENRRFKRLCQAASLNFFLLWEVILVREAFDERAFNLSITIINLMAAIILTYYD